MKQRLLTALLLTAALCHGQQPIPIIFDTDIGDDIDDALALALALQSPELDVRAATTLLARCIPSRARDWRGRSSVFTTGATSRSQRALPSRCSIPFEPNARASLRCLLPRIPFPRPRGAGLST